MNKLVIDVGGTFIKYAIMDMEANICKRELKQRIENAHRIRDNISTCDERLCFYWHMLIKFGFQGIHSSSISLVSFPACLESSFKR